VRRVAPLLLSLLATGLLAAAGTPAVAALDPLGYRHERHERYERPVLPGAAGPNRLEPDLPLLARAVPLTRAGAGLSDLRLFDAAGREVPYLLVPPRRRGPEWRAGRVLPILATKKASGFEVELGSGERIDRLRIRGLPAPFLKRFRLEGSGDRSRWTLLVAEGTLFDLPEEGLTRTEVDFPEGDFRYLRLTWDDAASARLPIPAGAAGTVEARLVRAVDPGPPARVPVAFERRPSEPGRSRFRLRLPAAHLPVVALELAVPGGALLRPATVTEGRLAAGGNAEIRPVRLGAATLRRAVKGGIAAADLRIPLDPPEGPDLELSVDDGDNPPLPLAGVTAELAPLPWIYFEAADTAPLTARFGDRGTPSQKTTPPRYDLEAMREGVARTRTVAARWGEVRDRAPEEKAAAASPLPALGAPLEPAKFHDRRALPAAPPGLTALLLDAAVLSRSPGLADLRIADPSGRQVPYLVERRDEPLALALPALARQARQGDPPGLSRYRLELPYPSLPAARLVLATSGRVFEREVRLVEIVEPAEAGPRGDRRERAERGEPEERTLAQATWRHADPDTPAPPLTLEVPPRPKTRFDLLVEEGDNAPLPLGPPQLLLPAYRLRFFYPAVGKPGPAGLTLLYGQPDLPPPRYDLSLLAPRLLGEAAQEIALAPERRATPEPDTGALGRKFFWGSLVGAVLVLLFLLGRLLRGAAPGSGNAE
jgi:uncharacterized protein DUF3999